MAGRIRSSQVDARHGTDEQLARRTCCRHNRWLDGGRVSIAKQMHTVYTQLHSTKLVYRYAFIECSQVPRPNQAVTSPNGLLHSLQLGSTGVIGTCFMFKYAIDGLSSAGLRVLLHPGYDEYSLSVAKAMNESAAAAADADAPLPPPPVIVSTTPSPTSSSSGSANVPPQDVNQVLWHAHYHVLGRWQQAQILYTYPEVHTVGIPYARIL